MSDKNWPEDYAERGIGPNTYACFAVDTKTRAKQYVFNLLLSGVQVIVAQDRDDPKRYHVAVPGGLAGSPMAWIVNVRGEAHNPQVCTGALEDGGQHPIKIQVKEEESK